MHEEGKLASYDFALPETPTPSEPGKIYVVSQENKSELPNITQCHEGTSAD
ncbi:hypothetical protein OAO87_01640 [bacterium]|nr:hypothetical protein [bacterium]